MRCYQCETNMLHPWHDDGSGNAEDAWVWELGNGRGRPLYDGEVMNRESAGRDCDCGDIHVAVRDGGR